MPKGPRGETRPADVAGAALKIMRIATGEETEELAPISPGAALGKLGGEARARNLTAEMSQSTMLSHMKHIEWAKLKSRPSHS